MKNKLLALCTILVCLTGCSRWSADAYHAEGQALLISRVGPGMTYQDFQEEFPDAKAISSDGSTNTFLVSENRVCFMCRSGDGFVRSEDIYAAEVTFNNGVLVSSELVGRESMR